MNLTQTLKRRIVICHVLQVIAAAVVIKTTLLTLLCFVGGLYGWGAFNAMLVTASAAAYKSLGETRRRVTRLARL